MSRFKTYPINKDPNWRYRPACDTDVARTIARARKQLPLITATTPQVLEVDEVQDAVNPSNIRNLRFARRAS